MDRQAEMRSIALTIRFSDTGPSVPSVWAKRLTRSSSSIQRIASRSASRAPDDGLLSTSCRYSSVSDSTVACQAASQAVNGAGHLSLYVPAHQ